MNDGVNFEHFKPLNVKMPGFLSTLISIIRDQEDQLRHK